MIVYLDSSALASAYLVGESDHEKIKELLSDAKVALITGTWTRIEVSGALIRAARAGRGDEGGLLALLDGDLGSNGPVSVIAIDQNAIEDRALPLVREFGIRAMDAWHLAAATLMMPSLAESKEICGFATRDEAQATVARSLGFEII